MENKFTPGPWRLDWKNGNARQPVRILGDGEIAQITYRGKVCGDSWEANARLIAAAPALFAALEIAHDILTKEFFACDFEDCDEPNCRMVSIRAAIALAKGDPK